MQLTATDSHWKAHHVIDGVPASRLLMLTATAARRTASGPSDRTDKAPAVATPWSSPRWSSSTGDRTAAHEWTSAPPPTPPSSALRRRRPVPNNTRDQLFSTAEQPQIHSNTFTMHDDMLLRHSLFLTAIILKRSLKNYYYATTSKSTQPSIPPGSVNEYQLWLERQRQVWFIPLADERGVCR